MTQPDKPGYVYRAFDSNQVLLYVGCTLAPAQRFAAHQGRTDWWASVAMLTLERFPTRLAAFEAEDIAIRSESPKYNVLGGGLTGTVVNRAEMERRRLERQAKWEADAPAREAAAQRAWLKRTYDANGSVVCANCGRYPERMIKGTPVEETLCKQCRCTTLRLVSVVERESDTGAVA